MANSPSTSHHMNAEAVYLAVRANHPKLRAVDALSFARKVAESGMNYATRTRLCITTQAGHAFCATPTEYKRGKAWNPEITLHGRRVRFLERCQSNESLRFAGFASDICSDLPLGWYCDNFQHETYRAAIWQLPGRKGEARYLAGYLEPWNDGALIDVGSGAHHTANGDDHTEAMRAAARDADSMAAWFSEAERDYQTREDAKRRIAECRAEIAEARAAHSLIIAELRALPTISPQPQNLCKSICAARAQLRQTVRELRQEIERLTAEPWTINPSF